MANPDDDEWWASTAPTPVTIPSDVFYGEADDEWWESTKPQVSHASLDPTPEELEDDDYWNGFTSWARRQGPVTRTLGRIPVRVGEDLYNALNDYFEFSTRANWEDEIFDEPQSAVEDITAEIGSWLGTFWVPGGAVAKVATSVSKATGISKKATKLSGLISTTAKGKKALRVGQIAAEGALRGAVADYITTDIEDHEQNLSIQRRFEATIEGGLLGAGVNLTTFGIGRHVSLAWRKLRALKRVRQASEGKADPVGALKELKKVIEDENQIKDDVLAELKPSDDLVDEADPELNKIFDEPEPKVEEPEVPTVEPEVPVTEARTQFKELGTASPKAQEWLTSKGEPALASRNEQGIWEPQEFFHAGSLGKKGETFEIDLRKGARRAQEDAFFVSTSKSGAKAFDPTDTHPLKVAVNINKPWDFENPEHVQDVIDAIGRENLTDAQIRGISRGHMLTIENNLLTTIKEKGYDGFFVKENDIKNLGVFDPAAVKLIEDQDVAGRTAKVSGEFGKTLDVRGAVKPEVEAPKAAEPTPPKVEKDPELQIEEYIDRATSLPDQIRRMVTLEHGVATRLNPKINNLIELLNKGDTANVRKLVSTLEVDIRRYRKLMEIRARAGKITGQSLRAFAADPLDFFSKSMVYKPEVIRRMNQIDSLLKLTRDVKAGKIKDEVIIKELNREIADVESVIKGKSLADALSDSFGITVDDSVTTIWGNYKSRIAKNVANTLKKKSPQQKATLDIFSTRITKTLSDAVKSDTKVAKKVSGVLDNVQDILANPEKYRESITKTIKQISEAKNIKAADKSKAIDTLTDLVEGKEGKRLFDLLPNREKLVSKIINEELKEIGTSLNKSIKEGTERELLDQVVKRIADKTDLGPIEKEVLLDHVRADLSNALAEMRDQVIRKFRSKELFQKFNLRSNIRELDEMSDKSIKEIREYLARKVGEKQTPADIKALQTEAREALKVLKDKVKQADIEAENELTKRFIKELSGMQEFDISAMGNFELMLRAFEKLRLNMMLFSPRTWLVGVPSAAFNVAYQPVQQSVKTFLKAKTNPFEDISTAKAFKLAQAEIQGMSEYFSNFNMFWELIKETYRNNGQSAILPRSFRRHEEDLIEAGTGAVESKPLKVTFKDKKKLAELIRKYGVKNEANEKGFRKFMLELVEGEPTTQMGRILDPVFSVSFRAMGILDEPFKAMGLMRALRSQALREGISKGLDEKALNIYVEKRMKEALVEKDGLPQWAGKEEFDEVEQLGLAMTYQADYADKYFSQAARAFSNWSRGGEDAHYNPLKIAFRLQVPFIKTPTAIAQFGLDHFPPTALIGHVWKSVLKRSPLHQQLDGLAKEIEQNTAALTAKEASEDIKKKAQESLDDLLEKQQELTLKLKEQEAEATTNMIMGTALTSSLAFAATTGAITGTGAYLTPEQKQRLIDSGWRPNSIMIGDKRVSYGRLEPWSTFMSSMADIVHYMGMTGQHFDELSDTDKSYINALQSSIVENMTNKFFIRGLYETLELALNPKKKAMDLPVNFLGSLTPTIVRDVATMNEQFQREAIEWQAQAKERTLGLHPGQYRRNLLGEKVNRVWGMEGFWGIISPVTWTDKPKDKLMEEIAGLRGKIGQTHVYRKKGIDTRKFYHKKTGQSLYDAWMDKLEKARDFDGLTLRNRLNLLIKSQEYLTAPQIQIDPEDIPKSKLIVNEVSKFRNDVWSEIENDPKFRENFLSKDGDSWTDQITNEGLRNKVLEPLTELVGF